MKIYEKAKMYDMLMEDVQKFVTDIETYQKSVDEIETADKELIECKQNGLGFYHSMLAGKLQGSNFGLSMKVNRFKGIFNWYQKQK